MLSTTAVASSRVTPESVQACVSVKRTVTATRGAGGEGGVRGWMDEVEDEVWQRHQHTETIKRLPSYFPV